MSRQPSVDPSSPALFLFWLPSFTFSDPSLTSLCLRFSVTHPLFFIYLIFLQFLFSPLLFVVLLPLILSPLSLPFLRFFTTNLSLTPGPSHKFLALSTLLHLSFFPLQLFLPSLPPLLLFSPSLTFQPSSFPTPSLPPPPKRSALPSLKERRLQIQVLTERLKRPPAIKRNEYN